MPSPSFTHPPRRRRRLRRLGCGLIILVLLLAGAGIAAYQEKLLTNADKLISKFATPTTVAPAAIRIAAQVPTPMTSTHRHLSEKRYMLDLINQERERAGVPPVELGYNAAAQRHAESALEHCFSSHWGKDGLKPYMRYSLAGGYQSNGENWSGLNYCYKASDGYSSIRNIDREIDNMMEGWLRSPAHRRNILDPWHKRVNIGLAWNRYNLMGNQHFEGDYVKYDELPSMEDGILALSGTMLNGAQFDQDNNVDVMIYYDPPPRPLTRGQLSSTHCYDNGARVAYVRKPLTGGRSYREDSIATSVARCLDPYDVPPGTMPPSSPDEAYQSWQRGYEAKQNATPVLEAVPAVTASKWMSADDRLSIIADLSGILSIHGAGVYTVLLWAHLGGSSEVISVYSIFQGGE